MASLDSIAADQRAVLQMILRRGLGYDEIAALLGIDRAAVRQRALDGFDALAAPGDVPALQRALITDYLLGQLPQRVADDVYDRLASNDGDRDWAHAIGDALGDAATGLAPLPDTDEPPLTATAEHTLPDVLERYDQGGHEPLEGAYGNDADQHWAATVTPALDQPQYGATPAATPGIATPADEPSVSRRGGALLIAIPALVLVAAVVVVALTVGGGHKKPIPARFQPHTSTTPALSTSSPATTSTPATTTATPGSPKLLAALNLSSPTGAKGTTGIVQVIRESGLSGIVVVAQGMPANGAHNAYAIWLRNDKSGASKIVGYLQTKVGKSGKLETEGQLPDNAGDYDQLLITLETQPNPSSPGQVILSGPFREKR